MSLSAHTIEPWTPCETEAVRKLYELGEPTDAAATLTDVGWDAQRARCRICTTRGEWFLKKHHPSVHRPEQHAVVRAFIATGGSAPEIIARPSGETWLDIGSAFVEVHRVVEGGVPTDATEQLALDAVRQVTLLQTVPVDTIPMDWRSWHTADDAHRLIEKTIERAREVDGAATDLEAFLTAELAFDIARIGGEHVPVHGDLWRGNWVAHNGRIAALTDFDWLHRGSPMEDLADVILAFATNRDVPVQHAPLIEQPNGVHTGIVSRILDEYANLRGPVSREMLRLLPDLLRSAWLRHMVWIVQALDSLLHLSVAFTRTKQFQNWLHVTLPTLLQK